MGDGVDTPARLNWVCQPGVDAFEEIERGDRLFDVGAEGRKVRRKVSWKLLVLIFAYREA